MNPKFYKMVRPKNLTLLVGIILLVLSCFLPLTTSCRATNGPEEFITTTQYGFETFNYYLSTIFILLIIAGSHISKGSFIATSIFVLLGGGITLFSAWINIAGWGAPCGNSPTMFYYLLYLSHILIIIACYKRIASKRNLTSISEKTTSEFEK